MEYVCHHILVRLFQLLQQLPQVQRRQVISQWLSEEQRLQFESFLLQQRMQQLSQNQLAAADSSENEDISD